VSISSLSIADLPGPARAAATYGAAVVHALAREEHRGRRPKRLTEPGLATWKRFRGWLGPRDLVELVLEDAATTQPVPFEVGRVFDDGAKALRKVPQERVGDWLGLLGDLELDNAGGDYIIAQAALLGIDTRLARSDLHKVKAHHRVLELPGTGGQLAYHMVRTQDGLYLQDVFTIACDSWQELTLAGLVAVELGLTGEPPVRLDPDLEKSSAEREKYTHVVGLSPDKGGLFEPSFLAERFPHATMVLV
jgi:hypothetical protein